MQPRNFIHFYPILPWNCTLLQWTFLFYSDRIIKAPPSPPLLMCVQRDLRFSSINQWMMMIQSNIQDPIKKGKKIRIPKHWHFLVEPPKQFCPIWYSICVAAPAAPLSIDSIFNRFSSSSGNDCCMPTKVFFTCTLKIDFLSRRKF